MTHTHQKSRHPHPLTPRQSFPNKRGGADPRFSRCFTDLLNFSAGNLSEGGAGGFFCFDLGSRLSQVLICAFPGGRVAARQRLQARFQFEPRRRAMKPSPMSYILGRRICLCLPSTTYRTTHDFTTSGATREYRPRSTVSLYSSARGRAASSAFTVCEAIGVLKIRDLQCNFVNSRRQENVPIHRFI